MEGTIVDVPSKADLNKDLSSIYSTAVSGFSAYFWPCLIAANHLGKIGNFTAHLEEQKYKSVITSLKGKVSQG